MIGVVGNKLKVGGELLIVNCYFCFINITIVLLLGYYCCIVTIIVGAVVGVGVGAHNRRVIE